MINNGWKKSTLPLFSKSWLPKANGRILNKENNKKNLPNTYIVNDKHFALETPDFFNKAEDNGSP